MGSILEDINSRIIKVKEDLKRREELEGMLKLSKKELKKQENRRKELGNILNKKEKEISRLEISGIKKLLYSILKTNNKNISKEKKEYTIIKFEYDECRSAIYEIQRQIKLYEEEIGSYYLLDVEYEDLIKEKEEQLLKQNNEISSQLLHIWDRESEIKLNIRDLKAIISAGKDAKVRLKNVITELEGAKSWGTWDMFGGGAIATAAKHSKINKAKEQVYHAQKSIKSLNRQLSYVNLPQDINIEIGSFETFADYFFDGFIADWFVQGKILDSLDKTKKAYDRVSKILYVLEKRLEDLSKELDDLIEDKNTLMEEF